MAFLRLTYMRNLRITVMNNNNDDQGARPPQFKFCQPIYMRNPSKIKSFCAKTCYLRPSFSIFMNLMQQPGTDLPYDAVPMAPLSDCKTFFGLHLHLAGRFCESFQSTRGPTQCKSGLVNNMVSMRHFSITIHLHLASFYTAIYF